MRVLYDVSLLGKGHRGEIPRTGVFRAVEETARALARAGGVDLAFGAPGLLQPMGDALAYLAGSADLAGVPVIGAPGAPTLARMLFSGGRRPGVGGAWRWARDRAEGLAHRVAGEANRRIPEGVDVFHSPALELPPRGRPDSPVQRFLTVYDLIAVRFPQFFEPEVVHGVKNVILGSLLSDDWVVADSENTRADLCAFRPDLDPSRVFVTPLAADRARFHPVTDRAALAAVRGRYGIPDGPYLLSLNTLEPRKNLDRLVRSFARFAREEGVDAVSLVLVGATGWKTETIFQALGAARCQGARIVLAGFVADADLAALYSGATAFVYPSLYEGFGLPPLEAMQCGVPVITSNNSSLPEVVGGAGIMVDPTDDDALSQAMLDVYRDAALRERMRVRSLARAAGFSWERCAQQTIAAYRAAVAGR